MPGYTGYKKDFQATCFFHPVGVSAQLWLSNHPCAVLREEVIKFEHGRVSSRSLLRSQPPPRRGAGVAQSLCPGRSLPRRDGVRSAERRTHSDTLTLQESRRQVRSEDTSLPADDCNTDLLRRVCLTSYSPAANAPLGLMLDTAGEQLEMCTRAAC